MQLTEEEIREIFMKGKTKTEIIKLFGYNYQNSRISKYINELIEKYNIDDSRFKKYKLIEKTCPVCSKKFETLEGHRDEKTVCSCACSNSYFIRRKKSHKDSILNEELN